MSLEKGIRFGKEHRRPYWDSRALNKTCRCHGSCPYCSKNRKYKHNKKFQKMLDRLKEQGYN